MYNFPLNPSPCGDPILLINDFDFAPLIFTSNVVFDSRYLIILTSSSSKKVRIISISLPLFIVSNALLISIPVINNFSLYISILDTNHLCVHTISDVLLNSRYALCDFDRYSSVLDCILSSVVFDRIFLIIGRSVTARKFSFGPLVLFTLLIGASIPFPVSISLCSSKFLFNTSVIFSYSMSGPYFIISDVILSCPGALLFFNFFIFLLTSSSFISLLSFLALPSNGSIFSSVSSKNCFWKCSLTIL